ncbi:MAG: putative cytokinetic ring protein SteA, partial [Mycobacterium sp.]
GADVLRKAGYRPQLIVGDPDQLSADVLRCGAQVVLPADADGHAPGLERIQDLGVGAMTFPATGSAMDLALLLAHHHGAALLVTAGHTASIETFFDRTRQHTNPSMFLTRLKVGEKLVDARAVATLYRNRISGGAIALLVLTMLIAVIVALWVSRTDTVVLHWILEYWNRFSLWVQGWVT